MTTLFCTAQCLYVTRISTRLLDVSESHHHNIIREFHLNMDVTAKYLPNYVNLFSSPTIDWFYTYIILRMCTYIACCLRAYVVVHWVIYIDSLAAACIDKHLDPLIKVYNLFTDRTFLINAVLKECAKNNVRRPF